MPDDKDMNAPLLADDAAPHPTDVSPAASPSPPPSSSIDSPQLTKSQPARLPSYAALPSSSPLSPAASYTVYQPPTLFHTSHPRPPPLLLIPATPAHHPSQPSYAPLSTPLTAVPMALDTILVRTPHRFSWSSLSNQYLWPLSIPSYASPHLLSYVSPGEWEASMARLNAALRWPARVQVARLVLFLLTVFSFCAVWSHEVREKKAFTVACWATMLISGIAFVVLTKVYGGRVRRALEAAVEEETAYYEGRGGAGRDNRLPCSWRMDEQHLVVSAPTVGPAHLGPLMSFAVPQSTRHASPHDYQHDMLYSTKRGVVHTPMAHY